MTNQSMTRLLFLLMFSIQTLQVALAESSQMTGVVIVYTTDVHGHLFPYDFINGRKAGGSMARVATMVDKLRETWGSQNVILLDNGDILQGHPTVYYYNYIDTVSPHIVSDIYSFMEYDAVGVGNHDIETGHAVYDHWKDNAGCPILAANIIDRKTGQPYFQPYTIINRGGHRVAIIGLITPAIPAWLPEKMWAGLEFQPMEEAARQWLETVREKEHPDIVIGLFHSGHDSSKTTAGYKENESLTIARNVPGFDAILMGHDHQVYCDVVENSSGGKVAVINPANNANKLGVLIILREGDNPFTVFPINLDLDKEEPSSEYMVRFAPQFQTISDFVAEKITYITEDISTRDAYFGPSKFMTLLHQLQLEISGAQISMAAPLTFDGAIRKGPLTIADMFTLYKYENTLSTLQLTGQEILDYLEYSYDLWLNEINDESDHLIKFASDSPTPADNRLKNPSYNFDSASGIDYLVDVTASKGNRIKILQLSDGSPFDLSQTYTVAINSYRAGGGGNHLTEGAGLSNEELKRRTISTTDKDLRYYLMQRLKECPQVNPTIERNWKMIPEDVAARHTTTDRQILFSPESSTNQK